MLTRQCTQANSSTGVLSLCFALSSLRFSPNLPVAFSHAAFKRNRVVYRLNKEHYDAHQKKIQDAALAAATNTSPDENSTHSPGAGLAHQAQTTPTPPPPDHGEGEFYVNLYRYAQYLLSLLQSHRA